MPLSLLSAKTLISSCFFNFLVIFLRAYFITTAALPKPMATPLRTNPTGAAIPRDPVEIPPHAAIVSTMDKARTNVLYFVYVLSRSFLSTEIYFCISQICNLNALTS